MTQRNASAFLSRLQRLIVFVLMLAMRSAAADETTLLWGDTHLHTSHSTDAYAGGNWTVDPEEAYRFARGLPVIHPKSKAKVRIERPLDFLVVADHSDFLGLQQYLLKRDPRVEATPTGRKLRALVEKDPGSVFRLIFGMDKTFSRDQMMKAFAPIAMQPWIDEIDAAERNNEPGKFTAFAGWEWSAQPNGRNLHRVVFTAAGPDKLKSFFPISNLDSDRPEDLWAWLDKTSKKIDADFIAIPHNSNMSDGMMFDIVDSDGKPISAAYANTRARWEPVMEVTQIKGTSEANPALSPNDEFAEFELYRRLFMAKDYTANKGDYARYALLRGLEIENKVGVNPYKLGLIGSSDIHTGLSSTAEDDFSGAIARNSLPADRAAEKPPERSSAATMNAWELSASGLAGVWATENTRDAIVAAFKRKEVYATTGTRILLRVFAGFNFRRSDARAKDIAKVGYKRGVPMGSDIANAPPERSPSLLIYAAKDPEGANLDRVQVIKGWLDAGGASHEHVYDVAWSDDRKMNADGRLPPVGDTVDLKTVSYKNTIGAVQLATVWQDPNFDRNEQAFYYVRVLEIPTPRHQVYDAVALGMDPAKTGHPTRIQERAYSSPVWYTP